MTVEKRDVFYLSHILEASFEIQNFLNKVEYKKFSQSDLLQSAVIRKFEIMGEATKRVSLACRKAYSEIPWKKITGMRDILIHDYFGVDVKGVWNTVEKDLPLLINQLSKIVKKKSLL